MKLTKNLSKQKIKRLIRIKKIYDQTDNLQKTATILQLTRERVRQLLKEGENYGLYHYETYRSRRKKYLRRVFSRKTLVKAINLLDTIDATISKLGITKEEFKKLRKFFKIDRKGYVIISKQGKCLKQYSNVVGILGHHPTTTELDSKREWKNLWSQISRFWGGIDVFRKEYGIEKQKHKMASKLQEKWKKSREHNDKLRQYILGIIKSNYSVSRKELATILGIKKERMYHKLLRTMVKGGTLITVGKGRAAQYRMSKEN